MKMIAGLLMLVATGCAQKTTPKSEYCMTGEITKGWSTSNHETYYTCINNKWVEVKDAPYPLGGGSGSGTKTETVYSGTLYWNTTDHNISVGPCQDVNIKVNDDKSFTVTCRVK